MKIKKDAHIELPSSLARAVTSLNLPILTDIRKGIIKKLRLPGRCLIITSGFAGLLATFYILCSSFKKTKNIIPENFDINARKHKQNIRLSAEFVVLPIFVFIYRKNLESRRLFRGELS